MGRRRGPGDDPSPRRPADRGDRSGDGDEPPLAARARGGKLVVHGVVEFDGKSEPYQPRPGGRGGNIYGLLL